MPDTDTGTISPNEAAKRTGYSRTTIRTAIANKRLKATPDNLGHNRIRPEDLEAWLARKRKRRKSQPDNAAETAHGSADGTAMADVENLIKIGRLESELEAERKRVAERDTRIEELKSEVQTERDRFASFMEYERGRGLLGAVERLRSLLSRSQR